MSKSFSSSSISFTGALTILFIGLKLGHIINWPWIWVLSPLWISFLLLIVFVTVAAIILRLGFPFVFRKK